MSERVFDWRKRRSWLARIRHYAGDILTPELKAHISRERPDCWSDDLSWLPDWECVVSEFVSALTDYYSHFKGFHGCRPSSLKSYYEHGLLGQSSERLHNVFRRIFADVAQADVEEVIQQFSDRGKREQGTIWLLGCDKFLISQCGHYLIQGSEYLMALAANLEPSRQGEAYRFRLRNYGVPTVLEIDIPVWYVPQSQHMDVAKMILSEWGQLVARKPLYLNGIPPCYVLRRDIPPECLVGHHHPEMIRDPHNGYRAYVNNFLTCDGCQTSTSG
ncbi:hypothetical protein BZL41_17050 [Pseudomonas sp. PIC25]|uniref:hypothetical protein n=1 Tax=Pseudomonas sp. PIC25 TaxID=1958773 RepID=UPI000BAC07B3|nr:hypothetical protein [Pseudomonas sp. PIC25]PAU59208.1 hypothetical protein BZL41_17050 [Pseudomonas sp. PIC25]